MKQNLSPLADGKLALRPVQLSDMPLLRQWRNANLEWFFDARQVSIDQQQSWFADYVTREDDFMFVIEQSGKPVGQCALYNLSRDTGEIEFGRLLVVKQHRHNGIAIQAIKLLLQAAKQTWDIDIVHLRVKGSNQAAINLYRQCEFRATAASDGVLTMRHVWTT